MCCKKFLTALAEALVEVRCDNLSKLHDFTLHRLLVEAKLLAVHALGTSLRNP